MEGDLEIHVEETDGKQLARLGGEMDLASAHRVRDTFVEIAACSVVVDLSGVSFLDSSGIGVLLSARERVTAGGHDFTVSGASEPVRQVLSYSGLGWLLGDGARESGDAERG